MSFNYLLNNLAAVVSQLSAELGPKARGRASPARFCTQQQQVHTMQLAIADALRVAIPYISCSQGLTALLFANK